MIEEDYKIAQRVDAEVLKKAHAPDTVDTVTALVEQPLDDQGRPTYSVKAANLLAIAAGWAYSDLDTFALMMHRRGIRNNRIRFLQIGNDALFVTVRAFLIQSECGKLGILCFRGTEPTNLISWMTDASISVDPFLSLGYVHGGFYRNVEAIWPLIEHGLEKVLKGEAIAPSFQGPPSMNGANAPSQVVGGLDKLEALYITGHSLGAAMAAIAAATLREDPRYAHLWQKVRGVYTFGQPMVAHSDLAKKLEKDLGPWIFRHVYDNDIVPRLPPLTTGRFKHFGVELRSSKTGWLRSSVTSSQVRSMGSLAIGVLAWIKNQFSLTRGIRLPLSLDDHSPLYYMRVSQLPRSGSEFE